MIIPAIAAIAWGLAVNLMIAAAAIAWHSPTALFLVVMSSMLAFVCFVAQLDHPKAKASHFIFMGVSWILSFAALIAIVAKP